EGAVPQLLVPAQGIVDLRQQRLTAENIVGRMIIGGVRLKICRFDQRERGEIFRSAGGVMKKLVHGMVTSGVHAFELVHEQERERKVVEVHLPGDVLLIQTIEQRRLIV